MLNADHASSVDTRPGFAARHRLLGARSPQIKRRLLFIAVSRRVVLEGIKIASYRSLPSAIHET
jgi:hypothetical protein